MVRSLSFSPMQPASSSAFFSDLSFSPDDLPPFPWEPELSSPMPQLDLSALQLPSPASSTQSRSPPVWSSANTELSSIPSLSSFPASSALSAYEGDSSLPPLPSPKRRRLVTKAAKKSHRAVDAARRRREAAVLRRLDSLVHAADESGSGKVKEKLAVLNASADYIEQLRALVSALSAACKAKDDSLQDLAERLHDGLSHQLSQQALHSNLAVNGRVPTLIIEADSGTLLEANKSAEPDSSSSTGSCLSLRSQPSFTALPLSVSACCHSAFLVMSGWRCEDVLHRLLCPPCELDSALRPSTPLSACGLTQRQIDQLPLVRDRRLQSLLQPTQTDDDDGDDDGSAPSWTPCGPVPQYPSSLRLALELMQGSRSTFAAPWRCRRADGFVYEIDCTALVVRTVCTPLPDGGTWEKPVWIMKTATSGVRVPSHPW